MCVRNYDGGGGLMREGSEEEAWGESTEGPSWGYPMLVLGAILRAFIAKS